MKRNIPAALLLFVPALCAQPSAPLPDDDHQLIRQLLQRVNELEAEVKRLKGESIAAAPAPAAAATPTPPPIAQPQAELAVAATMPDAMMQGMHALPDIAGLQFRGFSDDGFTASTQAGSHSTFYEGGFNLFMTSRLSDQFSALGELVFDFTPQNTIVTGLQRAEFHYTPSAYFNLTAGRFHTAIGYYNTTYHHASWLLPTVERPFLFAFEAQGGILPTHMVGISATGAIPSGPLGLHYIAEMGNGRPAVSVGDSLVPQVQVAQSDKTRKAFNLAGYSRPAALPGFQTGFSVYYDRFAPTVAPPAPQLRVAQTIWDGYVTYHPAGFEFTNEVVELRHAIEGTNVVYHIPGFYSILAKDIGRGVTPYFSWQYINDPRNEPLFGPAIGLNHGPSTGIRWDFTDFAAFKIEYFRLFRRAQNDVNGIRADIAFTF
jgi:hypothetical protein